MVLKVAIEGGHAGFKSLKPKVYATSGKRTPDGEPEWVFNDKVVKGFIAELNTYQGVEVRRFDDPTGKVDIPLDTRTDKANSWGADIYVSIHHNALNGVWGTHGGVETHVYKSRPTGSDKLAKLVQPEVVKAYGLRNRGIKYTNLHVTRETKCDAILVEGGFMDSTTDIGKLRNDTVLKNAGKGIAKAVAKYGNLKKKPVVVKPKPSTNTSTNTYTVVKGDTLWGISKKFNISVSDLKAINGMKDDILSIGEKIKVSKSTTHKVVKGDTLWGLSQKYDVTVAKIKSLNGLKSDVLSIGDVLKIK